MPTELESKIKVDSHQPVRDRLRDAGASYIGKVLETNRILDRPDAHLLRTGCGLRIRQISILDGVGPRDSITFKGVKIPGKFKQREEHETSIDDANALAAILAALGYTDKIVFEKRRESWRLDPCTIELDEIPQFGLFVEVEGPSEPAVESTLARLGLSDQQSITESYVALLMAGREPLTPRTVEFRFK
ncbi:MAG: class IV adenylate cyclase [Phycisphaerae bacterium]|nr:class IV adenylate cyclase [Phycisphaerae bacterium]